MSGSMSLNNNTSTSNTLESETKYMSATGNAPPSHLLIMNPIPETGLQSNDDNRAAYLAHSLDFQEREVQVVQQRAASCKACRTEYPLPPGAVSWRCQNCRTFNNLQSGSGGGGGGVVFFPFFWWW
eukprot:TRINITY_DN17539_c0_g1_i1.p1 TRINITY_DN17539_c0_g1~~TRINITY_DN17539_c0_g1_i1.p1  ORF type:complete len:126 (+),score=13.23 TRINITY_DN17539_c0_g1_i1:448-825(+)